MSLETLGVPSDRFGYSLENVLPDAVPEAIRVEYNRKYEFKWRLETFMKFLLFEVNLREHSQVSERAQANEASAKKEMAKAKPKKERQKSTSRSLVAMTSALVATTDSCVFCGDTGHLQSDCALGWVARRNKCKRRGMCFRCLQIKHIAKDCPSSHKCDTCGKPHHKDLCDVKKTIATVEAVTMEEAEEDVELTAAAVNRAYDQETVLLQTVRVKAIGPKGSQTVRLFMDGGSQGTFISRKLRQQLGLPTLLSRRIQIRTFNDITKSFEVDKVALELQHPMDPKITLAIEAEVPVVTHVVQRMPSEKLIQTLAERDIAIDQRIVKDDDEIHLLLGANFYWKVVTKRIEDVTTDLKAIETIFGWTLTGLAHINQQGETTCEVLSVNLCQREETNDLLRQFWELSHIGILDSKSSQTDDEYQAIKLHNESVNWNGRQYEVALPWKCSPTELDSNFKVAERRARSLINRFRKDPNLYHQYKSVIDEQVQQGIVEEVRQSADTSAYSYYVPHSPVIKQERVTTKLRIVFDASSHAKGCKSLNDCLYTGPSELPKIVDLLMIFLLGRIAVTADIEQAFHRISVKSDDRDVMRFLWPDECWDEKSQCKLRTLRSTRVMFGMTASPFLLSATIKHHLSRLKEEYPIACACLGERMYVDDFIDSMNEVNEATKLYNEFKVIFQQASMKLVKWHSNSKAMMRIFSLNGDNVPGRSETKVLGV